MLLPVPQYHRADKLKPIIEFLGEESGAKNQTSLVGENLPVPKDSHPVMSNKKDSSTSAVQDGIKPSTLAEQNGISSSSSSSSQGTQANVASTLGSARESNGKIQTVNHGIANVPPSKTVALQTPSETSATKKPPASTATQPLPSVTEGLVKNFLTSKFGQALGKSLLDFEKNEDSSYKNILAQHFGSGIKPTASSTNKIPHNQDLIANLVSGLIHRPSEHDSTSNSVSNKNNEKISQPVKQESGATNKLSTPTVSIGNKVFSLTDLANSLLNENQDPNESKSVNTDIEWKKASRRHPGKQRNKEKIKKLNEKIATLETLSDALDALTTQLSPDEKSEDQNEKEISLSSDKPTIQEQRQKNHHAHHHKSDQFSEDLDMLGALLARGSTYAHVEKKKPVVPKDDKDSNYIMGIKGKKALSSADLEVLQNKINQAIEMAEAVGRQHDSAKQARPTYLPLLSAGKVGEDVGAQTREEVATIHTNQVVSKRIPPSRDSELQSLQDILTRLINNAMRKGTLNQLVQRWDRSGSPFADIAKNISLYLQGNRKLKTLASTLESKETFPTQATTNTRIGATAQTNVTAQMAKGLAGLTAGYNNFTSSAANKLFTTAVNNILGALSKRQGLHKSNSTNRSAFVTTNTLTNFKGVLLGGRINKLKHAPQTDSIAGLENKLMAEILGGHGNKTFSKNSSKPVNFTVGNNAGGKSENKIDMLRYNDTLLTPLSGGQGKEKLTYSSYETKNVSRTVRNDTLMDFMKSMEEPRGPEHLTENNKSRNNVGDKYSQVKPHINDLMSVIAASLLDLKDIDQDSPSKSKAKLTYENEKLLHGLPNDHKMSDFSRDDAVLEAPTDHAVKTNSSNKRPHEQHNSTESSTNIILLQNNTKNFAQNEKPKDPDEESQKVDLGDQTVTLTLETVDDSPTSSPQTNPTSKTQTGLRNNKVPHNLNVQSAITLGKINATDSRNIAHSFPEGQIQKVPTTFSDFAAEAKKPAEIALPSDGDGKLTTISPSPEVNPGIGGDFQAKSKPELPLGLQMNAIGRIAETDEKPSPTPTDLSAALTNPSDLSSVLASKNGETKSFEDKILPMASDLTSLADAKSGETESIVSKASPVTLQNPGSIQKPSYIGTTPESESRPTASEVREIATSIKALLKILNSYSKKLRIEDDADDSSGGILPTRSRTANRVSINEENTNKEDTMKPTDRGLPPARYNNNVYANFPQSAITLPKYVDSGVFENIREQPNAEANSYNWNLAPVHAHPQMPFDINPTKTSMEPQLSADQWRPGNEMARVTEELKDMNLPSIEDDPTVRAVQNMVAEENAFLNEKRKAIQKHKQQDSRVKSQLPRRPGVVGRNIIPKHKGHHRNEFRMEHKNNKKKVNNFSDKRNDKRKPNVRGRDVIPGLNNDKLSRQNTSVVGKRKPVIKGNTTHHGNKLSSSPPRMTENSGKKTSLVSSRDKIAGGSRNQKTSNNSVPASDNKKTTFKTKHDFKESLPSIHRPNATSIGAVNALKIHVQRNPEVKPFSGEILPHRLNNTQVTGDKGKSGKTNVTPKENVTNNGTVSKPEHVKAFKAKSSSN